MAEVPGGSLSPRMSAIARAVAGGGSAFGALWVGAAVVDVVFAGLATAAARSLGLGVGGLYAGLVLAAFANALIWFFYSRAARRVWRLHAAYMWTAIALTLVFVAAAVTTLVKGLDPVALLLTTSHAAASAAAASAGAAAAGASATAGAAGSGSGLSLCELR